MGTKQTKDEQARFIGTFKGKPIHEMCKEELLDVIKYLGVENDELRESIRQMLSIVKGE